MAIKCCRHCVPPKRHSKCHSTCPDYKVEKEEHEEKQKIIRKQQDVENAIVGIHLYEHNMRVRRKKYK